MKHEKVASSGVLKDLLSFGEIMEDLGVGVIGSDMPRRGFCWHVPLGAWSDFSMLVSRIVRVLRAAVLLSLRLDCVRHGRRHASAGLWVDWPIRCRL